jgi:hypothetical protein
VNDTYAKLLAQAGAGGASTPAFRRVLGFLALAGEGPGLPLSLLAQACQTRGGPDAADGIRDVLGRLGGLVLRRDTGTADEHAGLCHATLAEYLFGATDLGDEYPLGAKALHEAMTQAIDTVAQSAKHDRGHPVHRYALLREADDLWGLGDAERTLVYLHSHELPDPEENLRRWQGWLRQFRDRFDEDNPNILGLRGSIASWTNRCSNP